SKYESEGVARSEELQEVHQAFADAGRKPI
nr:RecName: Full=Myosin heavy chain, muscle [Bombyx mori]